MGTNRINGSLYTTIENKIATLEFGHPQSNSFPSVLLERLTDQIKTLSNNPDVSVILLKSEGDKTFCAGASFDQLMAITNKEEGSVFFSGFAKLINAMRNCTKIIVGRVQGKAVGGGVGLIAGCDYVLATEAASIKLSELSIGIGPFVIAPVVKHKIGVSALAALSLDPTQWKNAYWALEKGLYARVFENQKDLDKEIEILTLKLASYNPLALAAMKKSLWEGTQHWDTLLLQQAEISGELVLSDFTKNALEQFKRK
ncbi:enoyl-CoA hydratase/isomerase family protein [Galbibacter sp.]|uniref:enoyl-CoA hydratase/isomerase family protein n=1 Tax=Galbibacter sp. TaxID=2918471 RepID=UPI002C877E1B|nr:enoyl-CoA hydratase/isomerase family protein [Galbibacter sp.]HLV63797.1 enoyl-CoA hydratase/isomerase family protein [Galbibacter sp.]